MSLHVQRFAFDRVFTAAMPESEAPRSDLTLELAALRKELAVLRADHEGALAMARADGFEAGLTHARTERDTALLSAVDSLQAGIEALDGQFAETAERLTGEATDVALAAAELLAGRALEAAPAAAIDGAIGRVLEQVARGTELLIRVHPDLVSEIEARIADRQSKDRRRLNLAVVPDPALVPGDAHIVWEQGGLVLDAAARRAEIAAELETLLPKDL
ncbi:FliH/SctL family protein [Sphingosinithalassobacter sp. CS137]|uniref:FliH/SctL family protein n=1 Tax=Sphingosinithalassobacter sp. CS137 TaxID=2762748 RepID=UPI00165DC658|nr:FliH/SctL family protein [Sphingosinithalassobacter sp. CS137]